MVYCKSSTKKTGLRIILLLKFLNLLAIDYQPGSPCAGQIFANKYNLRLAFYMFDDQWLETEIQKQIVNFDQAENRLIFLDKMGSPIGKQTYKDVYKSLNDCWPKNGI